MKRLNNAFTLTELLVALGVIGILCAILLPIIYNLLPNQNVIMAKRAYYMTQTVVADLMNDEACYPDKTNGTPGNARIGFDDGFGYSNCLLWNSNITEEGSANSKFLALFKDKLDIDSDNNQEFTTKDGMHWKFQTIGFETDKNNAGAHSVLIVDVNDTGEPDCGQSSATSSLSRTSSKSCDNRKSWDRYSMNIYANGKIDVNDNWARQAIKVDRDITSDKENNDE